MTPIGIALIGCGTVGSGVAKLLLEQSARMTDRAGRPLVLKHVVVREPRKIRSVDLPTNILDTEVDPALRDPNVQIVVELIGGIHPAKDIILQSLAAGKDVVTANKAVLAKHGEEIFEAARKHNRTVAFEASVAGGIPIIAALSQGLSANQILSIKAILNGTSNFILTEMTEEGRSYDEALAGAQRLGYAEADPTLDVDGTDAAHKLAILARLAFGVSIAPDQIERRGIDHLHQSHFRFAAELGYVIKLLAEAWYEDGQLALHVEPSLLHKHDPLAQVRGAYNAIHVVGDAVGDALFYGLGAGQMPTASSVVADLIDLATGRAQQTFQSLRLWSPNKQVKMRPASRIRSRFYLRISAEDRPGVLADVAGILAKHQISIASVVQHEAQEQETAVPVVIMTHHATVGEFRAALGEIDQHPGVASPTVYFPVAE